jgi:hypothetical protein
LMGSVGPDTDGHGNTGTRGRGDAGTQGHGDMETRMNTD